MLHQNTNDPSSPEIAQMGSTSITITQPDSSSSSSSNSKKKRKYPNARRRSLRLIHKRLRMNLNPANQTLPLQNHQTVKTNTRKRRFSSSETQTETETKNKTKTKHNNQNGITKRKTKRRHTMPNKTSKQNCKDSKCEQDDTSTSPTPALLSPIIFNTAATSSTRTYQYQQYPQDDEGQLEEALPMTLDSRDKDEVEIQTAVEVEPAAEEEEKTKPKPNPKRSKRKNKRRRSVRLRNRELNKQSTPTSTSTSIALDFEDGLIIQLNGTFDSLTNTKFACKGGCINGHFKPYNQDWVSLEYFDQFKKQPPILVCGVYDGHGFLGHNSSKYCARHFGREFIFELYQRQDEYKLSIADIESPAETSSDSALSQSQTIPWPATKKAVDTTVDIPDSQHPILVSAVNALSKINRELIEISANETNMFARVLERNNVPKCKLDYGTTAVITVSDGNNLFVLNVGDSRCLLIDGYHCAQSRNCSQPDWQWECQQITVDHNPMLRPDECDRVRESGGEFFAQGVEMRLYPKDRAFNQAKRKGLAINMTRAVGHAILSKFGLIAVPETYRVKLERGHHYIVICGSDGLFDAIDNANQTIFEAVKATYLAHVHDQSDSTLEHEITIELLQLAEKCWRIKGAGDNISVVCCRIIGN